MTGESAMFKLKVLLILFLFCNVLLCCAPAQKKQLKIFENELSFVDCQIPKGVQVVHYPMIHRKNQMISEYSGIQTPKHIDRFFNSVAVYSQFHLTKFIKEYNGGYVFWEGAVQTLSKNDLKKGALILKMNHEDDSFSVSHHEILSYFPEGTPDRFEDLTASQKYMFLQAGGGLLSFILGDVDKIHRVTSEEEYEVVTSQLTDVLKDYGALLEEIIVLEEQIEQAENAQDLKKTLENKYRDFDKISEKRDRVIFQDRELALQEEVEKILNTGDQKNSLVIIAYGAAHELSDNFENYNFYMLPHACTMPKDFLSDPNYALLLIHKSDYILDQSPEYAVQAYKMRLEAISILEKTLENYSSSEDYENFWNVQAHRPFNKREIALILNKVRRFSPERTALLTYGIEWIGF